jgi:KUP system potassium uptake protein
VNWALMVACISLVIGFQSSSRLAAAYGVAVTTDMVFTTILFAFVARTLWKWSMLRVGLLASAFLVVDLAFWGANIVKIPQGGWFPLVIAGAMFAVMTTWKKGRQILATRMNSRTLPSSCSCATWKRTRPRAWRGRPCSCTGRAAPRPRRSSTT